MRLFFVFCCAILFFLATTDKIHSQTLTQENWRQYFSEYTGSGDFYLHHPRVNCLLNTSSEGLLIVGNSAISENDRGGGSYLRVILLDKNHHEIWNKKIGDVKIESWGISVVETNNAFVLCGFTEKILSEYENDRDFWVVSLNRNGDVVWQKTYGKYGITETEQANSIIACRGGGFIVAGTKSKTEVGYLRYYEDSDCAAYILKIDAYGNLIWQKELKKGYNTMANSVCQLSDNNYVMCGYTKDENAMRAYLVKFDNTGKIIWEKTYGNSTQSIATRVRELEDGNIAFCGEDNSKFYFAELNSNGDVVWEKKYENGDKYSMANDFIEYNMSYYLVGRAKNNDGKREIYGLQIDKTGKFISDITISETSADCWANAILVTNDNEVVIGGYSNNKMAVFGLNKDPLGAIVKNYVENKINFWQIKGEFESSAEYTARVNSETRNKLIKEYQDEIINQLKENFISNINPAEISISPYDADNQTFLLKSDYIGEFVLNVPKADAPVFKQNFPTVKFKNFDFYLNNDEFVLSHVDVVGFGNKTYTYNSSAGATYANAIIAYNFDAIEIDINESNVSNAQIVTNTISVGKSDVDMDIPDNTVAKNLRYALIVGCENYSESQTGANVPFATNDALIFKEYCIKTLGIPQSNIICLVGADATMAKIRKGIKTLTNYSKIQENEELFFYYSGHGLPDEISKESYIIPTDVSGTSASDGIMLSAIYDSLTRYNPLRATAIIDACFSGAGKDKELVAMKTGRIPPKQSNTSGNLVVFSASSGIEKSNVYNAKQHGLLTYLMLKKLQETKGSITYSEMAVYLEKEAALISNGLGSMQTPQLIYNPSLGDSWKTWKFFE